MNKISCTSFSCNESIISNKMALEDFIDLCGKLGIKGVELWDEHVEKYVSQGGSIYKLEKVIEDLDLNLITVAVNNHDFSSPDKQERDADIKKVLNWLDIVERLGCKILRVLPGDLVKLNRNEDKHYPYVVECFKECLKEAEERGIVLAVENCPKDTDPSVLIKLMEEFESPYLRTCPDIGNIMEGIRYSSFKPLIPYAVNAHAKTYCFDDLGEETSISYEKVIGMLKEADYNNYICIEFEGGGGEIDGIKKSKEVIKKYISR